MKEFEKIDTQEKEEIMNEYYSWLFESNDLEIEKEFLPRLAHDYYDPYIYYPKFIIGEFFNTDVMLRLRRISQLGVGIREKKECMQDRLEHSKGCFYNGLEEQIMLWMQNDEYKKYIEKNNLKVYLIAELIKKAAHDNGHMPLSHVVEVGVTNTRNYHEKIGKRNLLENFQIQCILSKFPGLQEAMEKVLNEDILNSGIHDEGNLDTDRQDFLYGDHLYYDGDFLDIHLGMYERKFAHVDENGNYEIQEDGSVRMASKNKKGISIIDVYPYEELKNVEDMLQERIRAYKEGHYSEKRQVEDRIPEVILKEILETKDKNAKRLIEYLEMIKNSSVDEIDLNKMNQMDEIVFYLDLINIAENTDDKYLKAIIPMGIPNLQNFMHMIYRYLNLHDQKSAESFTKEQKDIIKKIKNLIHSDTELANKLKNPNYETDNLLVVIGQKRIEEMERNLDERTLKEMHKSKSVVKGYNINEPIYVFDKNGRVFSLDKHPERRYNYEELKFPVEVAFYLIPELKKNGFSDEEIKRIKEALGKQKNTEESKSTKFSMSPIRVDTKMEDIFEGIEER